jgi:uncharacterized membrane protein YfcA
MEIFIISLTAFFTAILTFFSGFGLGTILTPVMIIFFPPETAVALTAVVHFLNNLFKLILTGKNADKQTVIRFGVPAIFASFLGASMLFLIPSAHVLLSYFILEKEFFIKPFSLIMGFLLFFFALADVLPFFNKLTFDKRYLPLGGVLSGFFGGLSGHQGALRSAFLIKTGLSKEAFVASGIWIASFIDLTRLSVYSAHFYPIADVSQLKILAFATLSAFSGAYIGNKLLKKITLQFLQYFVAFALMLISIALMLGIL